MAFEQRKYRRFHDYDYSRGAAMFITFGLINRRPLFGQIVGEKIAYNELGRAVLETLEIESRRNPDLVLHRQCLMPDHVHLRFYLRPGAKEPLRELGQFIANFKRWSKWRGDKLGIAIDWELSFYDRVLPSRETIDLADKYTDNNARKWALMHGNPPPLKVIEPLSAACLPPSEWWTGVGRVDWLSDDSVKIAAIRLSRSIPTSAFSAVCERLIKAVEKGYTLAGTWISPCERVVFQELVKRGLPIIRGSQDPLEMVYRPKNDEPQLFSEGRYLILSRVFAEGTARGVGWHGINDALAQIGKERGESVYVHLGANNRLAWDFA